MLDFSFIFLITDFLVGLLMISLLFQQVVFVFGDCRLIADRSSQMKQIYDTDLHAVKLFETNLSLQLICTSQCTATDHCYYVTIDSQNKVCTFYALGSNTYNTTGMLTYALEFSSTKVILLILWYILKQSKDIILFNLIFMRSTLSSKLCSNLLHAYV